MSEQAQVRARFHLCTRHLGLDPLYAEVKERVADMNGYLDTDSRRRQASTVVRLIVVTILRLIGTVATVLTFYTMGKSKGPWDFLEALSYQRLSLWMKIRGLTSVWRRSAAD